MATEKLCRSGKRPEVQGVDLRHQPGQFSNLCIMLHPIWESIVSIRLKLKIGIKVLS